MNIMEALKNIENIINESKSLPGTSKVMVDKEKTIAIIKEVVDNLPNELDEAGMVSRQKEAILDDSMQMFRISQIEYEGNDPV